MEKISLPQDFSDFLKLLIEKKVKFLLISGYAVTYHGYPRYTGDIDFFVEATTLNANKLVEVVKQFGFEAPNLKADLFTTLGKIVRLGKEPFRIEILNKIDGLTFEEAYPNRVSVSCGEFDIPVISLKDLKKNKAASGRAKDIADLENLS